MLMRIFRLMAKTMVVTVTVLLSLGFGLILFLIFFAALGAGLTKTQVSEDDSLLESYKTVYGKREEGKTFVSIPINGVILGERQGSDDLFTNFTPEGVVYGYEIKEQLRELAKEEDVAGVILEINSPGGTIYGTQAITDGVKAFKEKANKPVISYIGSIAASGGYWAAASGDEIITDVGTSIGSIGVILGPFKYYDEVISEDGGILVGGIETRNGVETEYITAGTSKDLGNPYRRLTETERTVLQAGVNNSYQSFVSYIAAQRGIEEGTIKDTIGALIYDDVQARDNKLVDAIGNKDEAYTRLATLTETEEFHVIQEDISLSFFESLLESSANGFRQKTVKSGTCLFERNSTLLAYYGDVSALCY